MGYANAHIRAQIEPLLQQALRARGWIDDAGQQVMTEWSPIVGANATESRGVHRHSARAALFERGASGRRCRGRQDGST